MQSKVLSANKTRKYIYQHWILSGYSVHLVFLWCFHEFETSHSLCYTCKKSNIVKHCLEVYAVSTGKVKMWMIQSAPDWRISWANLPFAVAIQVVTFSSNFNPLTHHFTRFSNWDSSTCSIVCLHNINM